MFRRYPLTVNTAFAALMLVMLLVCSGCSFPRIIIINDPLSAGEHEKLGKIYESHAEYDLAAQQYRQALEKDPHMVSSLLLLGDLSYRTKQYKEAESAYRKAIKLQGENGDIYNNLSWVYLEQNKIEKAEDLINTAMTKTPEHRAYYLDTQGVILLRMGKIPESITALKEAVALLPKDNASILAEAYGHLADAYRQAGDSVNGLEAEKAAEQYRAQQ
jgi:tetratricopeptide (TPR) repeat protein